MSGSESMDPEEPDDPSPHELGMYIVVCMCAIRSLIIYVSLCTYVYTYIEDPSILICMNTASGTLSN